MPSRLHRLEYYSAAPYNPKPLAKSTPAVVRERLANIRRLAARLGRVRLAASPDKRREAELLAAGIQEQAALIRSALRKRL